MAHVDINNTALFHWNLQEGDNVLLVRVVSADGTDSQVYMVNVKRPVVSKSIVLVMNERIRHDIIRLFGWLFRLFGWLFCFVFQELDGGT